MVSECTNTSDSWTSMTHAVIMESSQAATDDEFLVEDESIFFNTKLLKQAIVSITLER